MSYLFLPGRYWYPDGTGTDSSIKYLKKNREFSETTVRNDAGTTYITLQCSSSMSIEVSNERVYSMNYCISL